MSHYSVAVFHREDQNIEDLLAPYDENTQVTPYVEYTREQAIEYARKTFEEATKDMSDAATTSTYAVVTPDGEWHEPGSMGWLGVSHAEPSEALEFELHYKERFLDTADPEWFVTIIDCHI